MVQFFVPDVSEARQHGLEYSRFVFEPAIKFCRSLVSSVEISKPRRSRRARRSATKDFVLFVSFVVVIHATINQFAAPIMNLPITLANRRHLRRTSSQSTDQSSDPYSSVSIAACEVCLSRYVGFDSGNVGIHHARATDQPSSKAPSRAVVQFFVPDVSEARQHGLEYSQFVFEPAIKFCRSLVSSVEISKTTKITKSTKVSDKRLRALRVLRGSNPFDDQSVRRANHEPANHRLPIAAIFEVSRLEGPTNQPTSIRL